MDDASSRQFRSRGNRLILPFVVIISILIFFHELGHFLVGRWYGVKVVTFSIGFGPELFGFDDRNGTHWRVAAIPLGGYVRFFGDANAASMPDEEKSQLMTQEERAVSLFHKPVWQRIAIVAAGPSPISSSPPSSSRPHSRFMVTQLLTPS